MKGEVFMRKDLYFVLTHKISKCLRIANVSKLGVYLFLYLKENIFKTEKAIRECLPYNEDRICIDCYGKNDVSSKRGMENLAEKNIILYNAEERTIRLNCDPSTWTVTPDQHVRIMKVLNDENLVYKKESF